MPSDYGAISAGLAAGFDKGAEAIRGLLGTGLGFMEVGELVMPIGLGGYGSWWVGMDSPSTPQGRLLLDIRQDTTSTLS